MKKILLTSIVLLMAANLFALEYEPSWRRADWYPITMLKISSAAINDYSRLGAPNLKRSIFAKNAFVKYMTDSYKKRYPDYQVIQPYVFENSNATVANYSGAQLYHSNIVFFSGHGDQHALAFYDQGANVGYKAYGGDIKWVFIDACNVLNVNKSDKMDKGPGDSYRDPQKFNKLKEAFIGVHAILGYYSLSWEYPDNSNVNASKNSELRFKYFAKYFIEEDQTIWTAYKKAHKKYFDEVDAVYYADWGEHLGYEPAIAYIKGTDQYGRQHDGSTEKISSTYEVAMDPRQSGRNYSVKFYTQKYGTPEY